MSIDHKTDDKPTASEEAKRVFSSSIVDSALRVMGIAPATKATKPEPVPMWERTREEQRAHLLACVGMGENCGSIMSPSPLLAELVAEGKVVVEPCSIAGCEDAVLVFRTDVPRVALVPVAADRSEEAS